MVIEERLTEQAKSQITNAVKTLTDVQLTILRKLMEKQKLRQLNDSGELPLEKLMKTLEKGKGETLSYCSVSSDIYQDMRATGLLEHSGLSCYSALSSQIGDQILLFYGSFDQKYVDKVLNVLDSYYGTKSELTKDEFFLAAQEKDIAVFKGLSDEDLMLLTNITKDPGENKDFPKALPYSVVDLHGEKYVACLAEDLSKMNDNLDLVAAVYTSEQGPRVLEDIREQIKGRQARNIAIDEAKRYNAIFDRTAPRTRLEVTAHDFEFYKNNKEVSKIPLSDKLQLSRVYDLVDGMSDPVLVKDIRSYNNLSAAEQREFLQKSASPIQRESDRVIDVNMTEARQQLKDTDAITNYLSKVNAAVISSNGTKDLDAIVQKYEKAQTKEQAQGRDDKEMGGRRFTNDFDAR